MSSRDDSELRSGTVAGLISSSWRGYRLVKRSPLGRVAIGSSTGRRLRRVLRQAVMMRERIRFVVAGLLELDGIHPYHLRDGTPIWLRHPVDSWTFNDIFLGRVYALPSEVQSVLAPNPTVLDLGANVGLFGLFAFRELPGCRIVGYEPDPANSRVLEMTLAARLDDGLYELVQAAAGNHDGQANFALGLGDQSHQSDTGTPVQVHDVLDRLAQVDLAKIDIEGGEWPLLSDRRLAARGPRAIVLEYHCNGCPEPEPLAAAVSLLGAAGYRIVEPPRDGGDGNTPELGTLWALRNA